MRGGRIGDDAVTRRIDAVLPRRERSRLEVVGKNRFTLRDDRRRACPDGQGIAAATTHQGHASHDEHDCRSHTFLNQVAGAAYFFTVTPTTVPAAVPVLKLARTAPLTRSNLYTFDV